MLDYKVMTDNNSMYNTPPTYCIYIAKLVYEWILSLGGLSAMQKRNQEKAAILYDYLDSQDYYFAPVEKASRSMMNVTFVTGNENLDKKFALEAAKEGLADDLVLGEGRLYGDLSVLAERGGLVGAGRVGQCGGRHAQHQHGGDQQCPFLHEVYPLLRCGNRHIPGPILL